MAFRACDTAEAILTVLTEILRGEIRAGGQPRLEAIAREIGAAPAATVSEAPSDLEASRQGPLFD